METLNGGREVIVTFTDGTTGGIFARQIPIREYDAAFKRSEDEIGLCALVVQKPVEWIYTLCPESYEALVQAVEEVNAKGFFVWSQRQGARLIDKMNKVNPEVLRLAAQVSGLKNSSPELHLSPR